MSERYFEDVHEGMELPTIVKAPSRLQLFLFGAVTRNPHRIHYDKDYALQQGHPDVMPHGPFYGCLLSALITTWMGDGGFLRKFSYSNRRKAVADEPLTIRGKVTKKMEQDGRAAVELEASIENARGEVIVPATALVYLPRRR